MWNISELVDTDNIYMTYNFLDTSMSLYQLQLISNNYFVAPIIKDYSNYEKAYEDMLTLF